jgi:hypothetical protein
MFAGHGNARQITITEAVWVGTTLLSAGDYEVKWNGPGLVQVSFLRGNKMIVTARAIAAVAVGPHDRAAVKVQAISESSQALEGIVWKDVSLTFDTIHPSERHRAKRNRYIRVNIRNSGCELAI